MPVNNSINSVITDFTPTPFGSTTPGSPVGSFLAKYFRVGKMVYYGGSIVFFGGGIGGMVGDIRLPIPVPLDTSGLSAWTGTIGYRANVTKAMTCSIAGVQYLQLQEYANNNPAIQNTDLANNSQFRFAIWYLGT